jgi:hypothetical protein
MSEPKEEGRLTNPIKHTRTASSLCFSSKPAKQKTNTDKPNTKTKNQLPKTRLGSPIKIKDDYAVPDVIGLQTYCHSNI